MTLVQKILRDKIVQEFSWFCLFLFMRSYCRRQRNFDFALCLSFCSSRRIANFLCLCYFCRSFSCLRTWRLSIVTLSVTYQESSFFEKFQAVFNLTLTWVYSCVIRTLWYNLLKKPLGWYMYPIECVDQPPTSDQSADSRRTAFT